MDPGARPAHPAPGRRRRTTPRGNGLTRPPTQPRSDTRSQASDHRRAEGDGGQGRGGSGTPDEFEDHDAAVRDYAGSADATVVARLAGELRELLALDLEEVDYAVGVAELGMEVDPPAPYAPGAWLALVAERLSGPRAEYG
ncbi:contact-dependent growth inhibition system immunity protein [Streptomyces venezuelae]|uniref:contact-dependent growth inhibition system immunity protein n=1 Tax=Streptomyces venezuelae TaxID=54571 RepID=UPI001689A9D5